MAFTMYNDKASKLASLSEIETAKCNKVCTSGVLPFCFLPHYHSHLKDNDRCSAGDIFFKI